MPVRYSLSSGPRTLGSSVSTSAVKLVMSVKSVAISRRCPPRAAGIADNGYHSKSLVATTEANGAEAVIPTLSTRMEQRVIDKERYKDRNLAERLWSKIKQYRRVATRYEKTARNFLGFVHVACIMVLLK